MKYLKTALLAVYNGDASLTAALDSMYFVNKPASAKKPFGLILPVPGEQSFSSVNKLEMIPVQFRIEGRTHDQVSDASEALKNAYDFATLVYSGSSYVHNSIRQISFEGPEEHSGTWIYTIEYLVKRSESRS